MAKKKTLNKTQAVRDYLEAHPEVKSGEIAAALTKRGLEITANYVSNIKTTINKASKSKKVAKKKAVVDATPAVVETPTKANGAITLAQIKKVAQTVKAMGGFQRMTEVLEIIKEAGGMKKFKDLAEAMMVPETDAIPF